MGLPLLCGAPPSRGNLRYPRAVSQKCMIDLRWLGRINLYTRSMMYLSCFDAVHSRLLWVMSRGNPRRLGNNMAVHGQRPTVFLGRPPEIPRSLARKQHD